MLKVALMKLSPATKIAVFIVLVLSGVFTIFGAAGIAA
jgi:hypothetical protein